MVWQWLQHYFSYCNNCLVKSFEYIFVVSFMVKRHLSVYMYYFSECDTFLPTKMAWSDVNCLPVSLPLPGCEDIIVESLSLDSLVPILKWSSQPYGSKWVHRQAMHFLCEEFSQVVTSDVLYELGKEHLLSAIQSDYLQVRKPLNLWHLPIWGGLFLGICNRCMTSSQWM